MLGAMQVVLVLAFPDGQEQAAVDAANRLTAEWCVNALFAVPVALAPVARVEVIDGPSDADDIGRDILARAIAEPGPDA